MARQKKAIWAGREFPADVADSILAMAGRGNPVPLAERGRMYFLRDVQELLGRDEKGSFRKSLWWVKNNFAPDTKRKLGRDPYWWEVDVLAWLDAQRDRR